MSQDSQALADLDVEYVKRHGFHGFLRVAWPRIEPMPFVDGPHIELMARGAEYFLDYDGPLDLVVNVPPGTSKSRVFSILLQPYSWINMPWFKWIKTSYDQTLTAGFGDKIVKLVSSEWWQRRWPQVEIDGGAGANKTLFDTTAGGTHVSTMMGGAVTGKHADAVVFDDPIKPDDLNGSPDAVRRACEECWERITGTFSSRRANPMKFKRLLVMQRLHDLDPAGKLLKGPKTVHLCLPMEYDPKRHSRTPFGEDWRREKGELLQPQRIPQEIVDEDKATRYSPRQWAAQFDQNPVPEEGNLIKDAYFQNRWVAIPPGMPLYLSVDANLKERKDTDEAVIQVWGIHQANYYLVDQLSGRWSVSLLMDNIKLLRSKWYGVRNTLVEMKANGPAVVSMLKTQLSGIVEIEPWGGKAARLESVEWLFRSLNVLLPAHDPPWAKEVQYQLTRFPSASNDDMVDATTQFLVWAMTQGRGLSTYLSALNNARAKNLNFR